MKIHITSGTVPSDLHREAKTRACCNRAHDSSTRRRLPTPFLLRSSEPELPFRFPAVRNLVRVFLTSFRLPRPSPEMTPEGYRLHGCFARFLLVFRKSSTSAINSWIVADPPAISPAVTTMSVN